MIQDGLWCCFSDRPMGYLADTTATIFDVTREEQDQFALSSHQKATRAIAAGSFREEITPVSAKARDGTREVDTDEGPRPDTSLDALAKLAPAFPPGTTVTAGNSSQISDGAASVVISSEAHARDLGLRPLAHIEDYTFVANDPARLFEAPATAVSQILQRGGLTLEDIGLLEVNEAFAAQVLANGKVVGWDWDRVNVNGGAIALGHPIGASGARILVTLLYSLKARGLETGAAALCHGGGGSVAMRIRLA